MEIHLRTTGCLLPYGITRCHVSLASCHPAQANTPRLNPSWGWYSIYLPQRHGRLSWYRTSRTEYCIVHTSTVFVSLYLFVFDRGKTEVPCAVSRDCWQPMTASGYRGYSLTHQVFYLEIAQAVACIINRFITTKWYASRCYTTL